MVQIVVATFGESHKLLRFVRELKQTFAKTDRNGGIAFAVHDQKRRRDGGNALVGVN